MKFPKDFQGFLLAVLAVLGMAGAVRAAPLDEATRTDAMIPAGDVVLGASLYRPKGAKGDLPAVVLAHGSAPSTRKELGFYINNGLRMGLAVVAVDKRGTGQSTGVFPEWNQERSAADFQNLANDVVYSVRWLARQPGVDTRRMGLLGGSQAGWIMPLAASQEPSVRFIIAGAGVPLPVYIEEAHGAYLEAVAAGQDRPTLGQIAAANAYALDYENRAGFDPTAILEKQTVPMLWIFGLYDDAIPTHLSIERIGELQKAGHRAHHIYVFPFADHNFRNVFTGDRYSLSDVGRAWLEEIGVVKAEPPKP